MDFIDRKLTIDVLKGWIIAGGELQADGVDGLYRAAFYLAKQPKTLVCLFLVRAKKELGSKMSLDVAMSIRD